MKTATITLNIVHSVLGKLLITAEVKSNWVSPQKYTPYDAFEVDHGGYWDDTECVDIEQVIAIRGDDQIPIDPKHWAKYANELYTLVESAEQTAEFQSALSEYADSNWR